MESINKITEHYKIRYNQPDDELHFYNAGEEDMWNRGNGQSFTVNYSVPTLVEGAFTKYKKEDVVYDLVDRVYRCRPFEDYKTVDLLVLGCSHTFGVGLPQEHVWHHQLADLMNIKHENICNLGVPSMGPNFVRNMLLAYMQSDMPRPKHIAILWPNMYRIEIQVEEYGITNNLCVFGDFDLTPKVFGYNNTQLKAWKLWENENPNLWNARQNDAFLVGEMVADMMDSKLAQLCWTEELNVKFVFDQNYKHRARDLMHMDKKQHGEIASMFIDRFGVSGSTAVSKTEGGGSIPPTGAKNWHGKKSRKVWRDMGGSSFVHK